MRRLGVLGSGSSIVARAWRRRAGPGRRERGSGTVLAVAAVLVLLAATVGALAVVGAVLAAHRASSAADLAALAAAEELVRGEPAGQACAVGAAVAARNGGTMFGCRAGADLTVELDARVPVRWAVLATVGPATARARAGPVAGAGP